MNQASPEQRPPSHIEKLVTDLSKGVGQGNLVLLCADPGMGAEYASKKALGVGVTSLDAQYLGVPGCAVDFDKALSAVAGPCVIGGLHGASEKSAAMALERARELAERGVKTILVLPRGMKIEGLDLGSASLVQHAPDLPAILAERFEAGLSTALASRRSKASGAEPDASASGPSAR